MMNQGLTIKIIARIYHQKNATLAMFEVEYIK